MTTRQLDSLVTRTELSPLSKKLLRDVRKAVISGRVGSHDVGSANWSIEMQTVGGYPARMTFSFKRDNKKDA